MKTLIKFFLLVFVPFFVNGQINTFHTGTNKLFLESFFDSISSCDSDTTQRFSVGSRLFSIGSAHKSDYASTYLLGASLIANVKNKITFTSHFDYLAGNHNALINEYQDSLGVFSGFDLDNKRWQLNVKYKLNKFISADLGKGKHFIGNGYRSLLLSSEHSPYSYLKLTTEFGRVKYYNLYTTLLDIQEVTQYRKKHASIHFLDFQLTHNINIGVFEGVLWQAKDENYNRGYDVEYLNPIIFYRPVEFSKNSPDNVLMGANLNATLGNTILYGHILIDDLNISEVIGDTTNGSSGFFQDKFAYQVGLKSNFKGINLLAEYNQAQPYTYAHKEPMQSYTHMNQALAHPLGANFKEVVMLVNYSKEKWQYSVKLTLAKVGLDSVGTHYGQNIFASDFDAQGDGANYSYGNFNGQGVSTQINTFYTEVAYSLKWFDIFGSIYYKKKKSDLVDQTYVWCSVGIRNFPFTPVQDY